MDSIDDSLNLKSLLNPKLPPVTLVLSHPTRGDHPCGVFDSRPELNLTPKLVMDIMGQLFDLESWAKGLRVHAYLVTEGGRRVDDGLVANLTEEKKGRQISPGATVTLFVHDRIDGRSDA